MRGCGPLSIAIAMGVAAAVGRGLVVVVVEEEEEVVVVVG
jgi:uncharacterized protein (UPF0254 family)